MSSQSQKARLIILADMGNEPDEEQQMVHMLLCSNTFHLDGLIAVTGKYLRTRPQPELFHRLLDGYDQVIDNLKLHADGWHQPAYLRGITHAGQQHYGMDDVDDGKASPGGNPTPTPRWVSIIGTWNMSWPATGRWAPSTQGYPRHPRGAGQESDCIAVRLSPPCHQRDSLNTSDATFLDTDRVQEGCIAALIR